MTKVPSIIRKLIFPDLLESEYTIRNVAKVTTIRIETCSILDVFKHQYTGEAHLTISLSLKYSTAWAGQGHEVAWAQTSLLPPAHSAHADAGLPRESSDKTFVTSTPTTLTVSGGTFSFIFDTTRGALVEWHSNGQALIETDPDHHVGIIPSCWRPATDNDVSNSLPYWKRFGVDSLTSNLRSMSVDKSQGHFVIIKTKLFLTPPVLAWGWNCKIDYRIHDSGTLRVVVSMSPTGAPPTHVPRLGLNLRLNKALSQARWLGLGPGESYPDKKNAQRKGIWEVDSIAELHTSYDVPQENGNRMGTRWLTLTGSQWQGRGIRASQPGNTDQDGFSFAASRYSDENIQEALHPPDLVEEDATLLRLDAKVAGVGTGACGPRVNEADMVKCQPYHFDFLLESI